MTSQMMLKNKWGNSVFIAVNSLTSAPGLSTWYNS